MKPGFVLGYATNTGTVVGLLSGLKFQGGRKTMDSYPIYPVRHRPNIDGAWDSPVWTDTPFMEISHFRPESSGHHPRTRVKMQYGIEGLYGIFRVDDQYVRSIHRRHQDPVYKDSCVEFFVHPNDKGGYFNFEFNCGGTLLASYVIDPTRMGNGLADCSWLSKEDVRQIKIYHSLPKRTDPEIQEAVTWYLEFYIPFSLLERYTGPLDVKPGVTWRCNFYKCADETSHPHWASWSPVDELNFHLPHCFGELVFMPGKAD